MKHKIKTPTINAITHAIADLEVIEADIKEILEKLRFAKDNVAVEVVDKLKDMVSKSHADCK